MPDAVTCEGQRFDLVSTFKHDFFAATGLYRGRDGLVVLKLGRRSDFLSVPLAWLGRFLVDREVALYRLTQDLPNVPRLVGTVPGGFLHEYIPGRPLRRDDRVGDAFFAELEALLAALHARHMAYVDLNKRENILLGEDGRPYLIDFQIALHLPPKGLGRLAPARWLLARFQHADVYHCLKHKRRLRPDLLTPEQRAAAARLSVWIRLHRLISRPFTNLRRRLLARLRRSERAPVAGSQAK